MNRAHFNAVWTHTSETPEWIAARGDAVRRVLADLFGIERWTINAEAPWEGDEADLAELVRARPVSEAMGVPDPKQGYGVGLHGKGPIATAGVHINAGTAWIGRRLPAHVAHVDVFAAPDAPLPDGYEQTIIAAMAEHFDAIQVDQSDLEVFRLSKRGGWKIPLAYRLWLHDTVGAITAVADGVSTIRLGNGTLLSMPDHWEPQQVVDAALHTLELNGLDKLPH